MEAVPPLATYDRLFGRAREAAQDQPCQLRLDVCGYEYATIKHGEQFHCAGCHQTGIGTDGRTLKVEVAYTDMTAGMGRRQARIGIVCDSDCAYRAFGLWYWKEYRG